MRVYANVWAGNIRPEEILRLTKLDPHSLGKWRVDGALPHIDVYKRQGYYQQVVRRHLSGRPSERSRQDSGIGRCR